MEKTELFTGAEALLIHIAVSERIRQIQPPEGRKGTKDTRWQLRQYAAILQKLEEHYPECYLHSHPPHPPAP